MRQLLNPLPVLLFFACCGGIAYGEEPAQSIDVTAQKLPVQSLIDRKVYSVTEDLQSVTGSAADILDHIPSVEVDGDGNVTLRGDTNVLILVDGRPVAQLTGSTAGTWLQQFPANDIEKIEVMTTPPAQYKADGSGGAINIVTKKNRAPGLSGSLQASAAQRERFLTSGSVAYSTGDLTLTGGVTLRRDVKQRLVTDDRLAVDPQSSAWVHSAETLRENLVRLSPLVKAGVDYQISDSERLSLSVNHKELIGHRTFDQIDSSGAPGGPFDSVSLRGSDGREWNMAGGQSASFEQKLAHPGEVVTLSYQRSTQRERERYSYADLYPLPLPMAPPGTDHLNLSLDLVKTEASLDYARPVGEDQTLKLGYDFEDQSNAFDNAGDSLDPATGLPVDNSAITNHFRYHQQIEAGYASYLAAWDSWTLQSGVRVEDTQVDTDQIIGDLQSRHAYFRVYPSLHADYQLDELQRLSAGLSRRVNRPDPEDLNPLVDYQDIHNLRAGNADLLPQDTWSLEAGYAFEGKGSNYGLTVYGRQSRDAVTTVTQVVSADVVLVTKVNLPQSRSGGVEFTTNGALLSELSYAVSGNLFYNQIDAGAFGGAGVQSTVGLNAKASLDWRPTAEDAAQLSVSRSDKRLTPQGYLGAIDLVNLGYKRQIRPDLAAVATMSDALNGQVLRRVVTTPTLQDTYQRQQYGQLFYVGLVYNFGGSKKSKGDGFDYDR
ncbi:MAG TPA: TonB-dependent receptor [Magnetospirillaceae bacterium]|nr:TonB-dependent receptor [Magnetospirillaceae bacterium]